MSKSLLFVLSMFFTSYVCAHNMGAHDMHQMAGASDQSVSLSTQSYQDGMDKMHQDMMIAYTGDADIDFARGMIPHHEGAIAMAETLLKYGKDPALKKMAHDIIAAQKSEVAFLEQWLKTHKRK